ncbi:glycosyltransferase family 2 protein [Methylovirgula ligni]|uniref:Glycosyl transferase family 2 n=1 Tax=Methylovirgula ligni TaxID=569860 RepID=A0A3D9Z1V2_9HYPH|nr:glycosyltransferase family 2 protein [Methylovirgula ligni]QAY96968.1 glycosyltransferase family 2 protein [Methylovirgula ligni]REF87970.1 glycosyl transferase family 2 [Methylovirgula ligni]
MTEMIKAGPLLAAATATEPTPKRALADALLPMVSFIVVNYNYGRFLRQCIDTIFSQTYPAIECILVDNKSTDESAAIIADLKLSYPQLQVIYEQSNLGQSAACLDGYRKSRGPYVVFVDADDYYFNTFAETHVLVHLSLRHATGFTSSDMTQVVDGAVVLGTTFQARGRAAARQFLEVALNTPRHFPEAAAGGFHFSADVKDLPLKAISTSAVEWVWAPTSGTMYRRDALAMFIDAPQFPTLRSATDAFFNFAINAFVGSVLIERPLGAYRIHGGNTFTRHPSLNNIRGYESESDMAPRAAKAALDHVLNNFDVFDRQMMGPWQLFRAISCLDGKTKSRGWQGFHSLRVAVARLRWLLKRRTREN